MTVRKNGKVTGRGAVHRDRGYKIQHRRHLHGGGKKVQETNLKT